jgi:hypothetical protein
MDCRDAPDPAIRTETERNRKGRPVSAEAYCAAPPRAVALRQRYLIAKPVLAGIRRALQCTNGRAVATPAFRATRTAWQLLTALIATADRKAL